MKVIHSIKEISEIVSRWRREGETIGLVPTMGWFHEGHLSLMRMAREKTDKVIVTLFVNPMQFGPSEDLGSYPRDLERDQKLAEKTGADILFSPLTEDIYPEGFQTKVSIKELSKGLCGASRPGHFDGVTTVVTKLFNLTQPDIAFFGEKDYQQLAIIRRIVKDLNFNITVVGHPIVREKDGLAMSSRNSYLTSDERKNALCLYTSILHAKKRVRESADILRSDTLKGEIEEMIHSAPGFTIDYVSIFDKDSLVACQTVDKDSVLALAVKVNDRVRLIDNAPLLDS